MKQAFPLVALLIVTCWNLVEGRNFYSVYYFRLFPNADCTKGYRPGGGIPIIEPIDAPVARAQKISIAFMAGKLSPASALGKELVNGAKTFYKLYENVAPKLVSGLGIFSASMGVLGSLTKPTPQDLLNIVNKAFKKLTDDINDRMNKMQGYVDGRVIQQETRRINNQLQSLKRHWTNCVEQSSRQNSLSCQRSAVGDIHADLPHFMILDEYYDGDKNGQQLEYYDVHRLEAVLIPFRDYASYHIYSLQMLVNELSDFRDRDSLFYRKKYLGQIVDHGNKYYKYAHWAYNTIFKRVVTDTKGYGKVTLNERTDHKEGWWAGVYTHSRQTVYPGCSKDTQSPINKCGILMYVRADGKKPSSWTRFNVHNVRPRYHPDKALEQVGRRLAPKECVKIMKMMERDLPNFWKPELLDVAESWKEAADSAQEQLKKL